MSQGRVDLSFEAIFVLHFAVESDRVLPRNPEPLAGAHRLRKRARGFSDLRAGNDGLGAAISDGNRAQQNVGAQGGNVDARVGRKLVLGKDTVVNGLARFTV